MIRILAVGKLKEDYLKAAVAEYQKRLKKFCKLTIAETRDVPQQHSADNRTDEAKHLLKQITPSDYVILLDQTGKQLTSKKLADHIRQREMKGDITLIIGGAFGVSDEIKKRANMTWSLSSLTFPHQLTRVILLEQLYRAYSIINNIKYHH